MGRKSLEISDLDRALSAEFSEERESRGWTEAELGTRAGISQSVVHRIISGGYAIKISQAAALAGAFGDPIKTFIARAERRVERQSRQAAAPAEKALTRINPAQYSADAEVELSAFDPEAYTPATHGEKRFNPRYDEYAE